MAQTIALRAGWMLGATREGLVAVGPDRELAVGLPGGLAAGRALVEAVALGTVPGELRDILAEHRALGGPSEPPPGRGLASAVALARGGEPVTGAVWTAEEALLLPPHLTSRQCARALHAFVAGLRPDGRLEAYALVAQGAGAVCGDVPAAAAVRQALAGEGDGPADIVAIDLAGGARWRVAPGGLDDLGAHAAHRLGPVQRLSEPEAVDPAHPDGPFLCVADIALADLAAFAPALDRRAQGVGAPAHARLVARAEASERYAMGDASAGRLVHARRSELPDAVDPDALFARTCAASADVPRRWAVATGRDGTPREVPAEAVYTSLPTAAPPEVALPWTSSGVAAHLDPAAARERAFCELVERDAVMWTWLRRVVRERIAVATVPDDVRAQRGMLGEHGWATTWVNLSLDTFPVVLCAATHPRLGLTVGAACAADPAAAVRRATAEALVLALRFDPGDEARPAPDAVRTPRDHLVFHRDPRRRPDHGFLVASAHEIALEDVPAGAEGELESALEAIGCVPLSVDLTRPATRPFHVVRALAPGLLPLTFGVADEPRGLARARSAIVTRDGRRLGDGPEAGGERGRVPHPLP